LIKAPSFTINKKQNNWQKDERGIANHNLLTTLEWETPIKHLPQDWTPCVNISDLSLRVWVWLFQYQTKKFGLMRGGMVIVDFIVLFVTQTFN